MFEIPEATERAYQELQSQRKEKLEELKSLLKKAKNLSNSITAWLIKTFGSLDAALEKSGEKIIKTRLQNEEHQRNIGKVHFARKKLEALKELSRLIDNLNMWQARIEKMFGYQLTETKFSFQKKWLERVENLDRESNEYTNW